jgi:hypothetical protein
MVKAAFHLKGRFCAAGVLKPKVLVYAFSDVFLQTSSHVIIGAANVVDSEAPVCSTVEYIHTRGTKANVKFNVAVGESEYI